MPVLAFETVVFDGAAKCVEQPALTPLKYDSIRFATVGDHNQLPPKVLSQTASNFRYEQSLFVWLQKNFQSLVHQPVSHSPHICQFSSANKKFHDTLLVAMTE
ncbi:hypothetical protein V1520DRAFT_41678 [Lipomyces starkeyi]